MARYLDSLTAEQRAKLLEPSAHLQRYRAFAAEYRTARPNASGDEVQEAYQHAENRKMGA